MKRSPLIFALALLACCFVPPAEAQYARYSVSFPSVTSQYATPFLVANIAPNLPILAVCNHPANALPCSNYATTYTSSGTACANGSQDTPDPQPSACQATGDAQGNIGFWALPGEYDYTVCIQNTTSCFGPYTVTLGQPSVYSYFGNELAFTSLGFELVDSAGDGLACILSATTCNLQATTEISFTVGANAINETATGTAFTKTITALKLASTTNCSNGASPAVCGSASAGSVVIAAAASTVVVDTTAVTANSEIFVFPDESAAISGVTCNTTAAQALATVGITARTPGASFTITTTGSIATHPACFDYLIVN